MTSNSAPLMNLAEPAVSGKRLRIAIIPAIFDVGLNYIENVFARTLHGMGHEVRVFTSYHGVPGNERAIKDLDRGMPFQILRTKRVICVGVTQIPWDGAMGGQIRDFDPEVAFVLAPNHGLGAAWVKHLPVTCPVIASFSDLPWHRGRLRTWIKRYWARRVIRRACKVITVTHQTQQLVGGWAGPQHAGKVVLTGLPFRPEDLAGGSPPAKALELSLRVRQLIVCVTRVSPSKQLDVLFKAMERHLTVHPDAGFVIAGFDDSAESRRLQDLIEGSPVAARCVILPLIGIAEIGGLFRIASCSVWSLVSIGIYHSIHCGCPVLVRAGQDAQHLLENPAAGGWFSNLEAIDEVLQDFLETSRGRTETSAVVERFHARNVLEPLLAAALSVEV